MSRGFGSMPGPVGEAGIPTDPPPDNLAESGNDYLKRIANRYDVAPVSQRLPLQLGINEATRLDLQGQKVNCITLTVVSGIVYVYLSDQTAQTGKAAILPDFLVGAGINPTTQQFVIPPRDDYVISFQEGSGAGAAVACARAMYL